MSNHSIFASPEPDAQVWIASFGGGDAAVRVSLDSSTGNTGYDIVAMLAGHPQLQHPVDIILDTVHDRFFIVDSDGTTDTILQGSISAALAGGHPPLTVLYSQTPPVNEGEGITGIALDPENGIVYFTERNLVQKVLYDVAGQTPVTIADLGFDPNTGSPNYANEIAFNPVTGQIFVVSTESFSDFIESPPGSGEFIIGTLVVRNAIFRVDNVAPSDVDDSGNTITKLEWDTFDQDNPFIGGPDTTSFSEDLGRIVGIDVDTATGQVYFTAVQLNNGVNGEVGGIYSIGPNGGAHTTLYTETNATDQNFQYIDVDNGRYFVTSVEPGTHKVYTHDLTAGAPNLVASVGTTGGLTPSGLHVSNAPTLTATDANATTTETAGAGSGFSSDAFAISSADANDIDDSALLSDELAGAHVRISDGFGSAPGSVERLTINGTTAGTLGSGISYSYDSGIGMMTFSGAASFADYEAALALVAYSISGDNPDANGTAPTRTLAYSVTDGLLHSSEQEVVVAVAGTNDDPTAPAANSVTTAEDTASSATAIGAADVDSSGFTYSEKAGFEAASGTVTFDQLNGTFTYTPDANFNGSDSFTILIDDGDGGSAEQAVSVTVTPVNDDPTAPPTNSVTTDEDTPSAATPINANDVDGDDLTYSEKVGFEAANGSVTFNNTNGTFVYTPDPNFVGSDSFTILIDDGNGGTAEQDVSVTVDDVNDPPTGVTGTLTASEDGVNGTLAGTLAAQDSDSSSHTFVLLNDAGGRFTMDSSGNVYIADGLLLDYEQANAHTIRVEVTDDEGASSEFDVQVDVADVLGEDVLGDGRDNIFYGGAETDILRGEGGNDTLVGQGGADFLYGGIGNDVLDGGAGDDTIEGGDGNDILNGGPGQDVLKGGGGDDVFVFHKGEAAGDTIVDFWGQGASIADSIVLVGYGAGTTFTQVGGGNSTTWRINDNGYIEDIMIIATGQVHSTDVTQSSAGFTTYIP